MGWFSSSSKTVFEERITRCIPLGWAAKNVGFIKKCVHEIFGNGTSFIPNSNNKTTTVETRHPSSATSLPHYHTFNEVMRSVSQGVIISTVVVLLRKLGIFHYFNSLGKTNLYFETKTPLSTYERLPTPKPILFISRYLNQLCSDFSAK